MALKKKIGRGRPKKIPSTATTIIDNNIGQQEENPNIIMTQKRGRGRPRKYPPNSKGEILKKSKLAPIPDLVGLMKAPGMASVWGSAQKGKRVNARKKRVFLCTKENSGDFGFPFAGELDSPLSAESYSNSNSNSGSKSEDSWFSNIVIPGPIPDLDELLRDPSIFRQSNFFSDVPDDWDFSHNLLN